jgi:hypothetical protein
MYQVAQNQDMMLQAARFIGLNVENIGVMDLIEGKKHKHLVLKLLQEIMTFEGMERLAEAARQYEKVDDDPTTVKSSTLKQLSAKSKGGRNKAMDVNLLIKFMNENLEAAGASERISPDAPLSESCSDSKVYLTILNYLSPNACPLDALKDEDPLERANSVVDYLSKLGMRTEFQNYDVVYGEDQVHQQIAASIATVAATLRMQQIMANGGDRKSEHRKSEQENSERKKTGTLSRKASAGEKENEKGRTISKSEKVDKTASKKFLGLFKKEKHETEVPLTAAPIDSYDIKDEHPPENTAGLSTDQGNVGIQATATATEELFDDVTAGIGGRVVESPGEVTNIFIEVRDPRKTRNLKVGMLLSFFFGLIFLVLGGVSSHVAKQKIETFISYYAPLKSSTGTLDYFLDRSKTVKFFVFSYENLDSAAKDGFKLKQFGPFSFEQKIHVYNSSFKIPSSSRRPSFVYMSRNEFVPENIDVMKDTYVTVPAYNYISAMSSSFVGDLVNMIPSAVSSLELYYNASITPSLSKYLIPVYLKYVQRLSSNVDSAIALWAANGTILLTNGGKVPTLSKPIPLNAAKYLFNVDNAYSLRRLTLNPSEGIPAWLSGGYDTVIANALQSQGLSQAEAFSCFSSVRDWINSVVKSSDFFSGLKEELVSDHQMSVSESSALKSLTDLGIYQFASGNLVSTLTSGSSSSITDFPSLFPSAPFDYPVELHTYLKSYAPGLNSLLLSQAKQFFGIFSSYKYTWAFMSVSVASYNSSHPFASLYSDAGVSPSNFKTFSSFLKYLAKMKYLKASGLGYNRELPPVSTLYPGMFIRLSVYDLLMGYDDPNLRDILKGEAMPFVKSYASDESHWLENFNDYNQILTGRDNVSDVFKAVQLNGKGSLLGIWARSENVSSFVEDTGISPFYKETTLQNFGRWNDALKRVITYSFSSTDSYGKFTVNRYFMNENTLKSEYAYPENSRYFMNGPDGVANLAPANLGAQIWISNPHFYGGENSLKSPFTFDSFSPSAEYHRSYVDIEGWSGSVMQGSDRYQVNLRLSKADWFSEPVYGDLFYNFDTVYAPLLWVDSSFEIHPSRYEDLYQNVYKWENGAIIFQTVFLIIGILLFLLGFYLTYQLTKKGEKTVSRVQSIFKRR